MAELDRVLSQLREEYSPDADAQRRVRVGLAVSLGGGAVAGAAGTKAAAAAAGTGISGAGATKGTAAAGSLLWVKWLAGVGVATAVAVAGTQGVQRPAPPAAPKPPSPVAIAAAPQPARVSPPEPAPQRAAAAPAEPTPSIAIPALPPPHRAAVTAAATPSREVPASTLLEEVRLLRQASQELRSGQIGAARASLTEHRRRFPTSNLAQERAGMELLAGCAEGKTAENRAAAERFVRAAPASPLAESLKRRCLE